MNFLIFLGVVVNGCIWGFVTNKVLETRGYDDNWFWWGFFFGMIAVLVAASKPIVQENSNATSSGVDEIYKIKKLYDEVKAMLKK